MRLELMAFLSRNDVVVSAEVECLVALADETQNAISDDLSVRKTDLLEMPHDFRDCISIVISRRVFSRNRDEFARPLDHCGAILFNRTRNCRSHFGRERQEVCLLVAQVSSATPASKAPNWRNEGFEIGDEKVTWTSIGC